MTKATRRRRQQNHNDAHSEGTTCSAPCPDLPTHLCLPVCESPLLTRSLVLLCVLTCPPICAFQFVSLTHLLPVLTFPFILASQFVSAPCLDCSLSCICTIF